MGALCGVTGLSHLVFVGRRHLPFGDGTGLHQCVHCCGSFPGFLPVLGWLRFFSCGERLAMAPQNRRRQSGLAAFPFTNMFPERPHGNSFPTRHPKAEVAGSTVEQARDSSRRYISRPPVLRQYVPWQRCFRSPGIGTLRSPAHPWCLNDG